MPRTKFESDEARKEYYRAKTARQRAIAKERGDKPSDEQRIKRNIREKEIRAQRSSDPEYMAKQAARQQRYRDKLRANGINPNKPYTEEQKAAKREYVRERRADAKALGIKLPGDNWAKDNPDAHRKNGKNWRDANPERIGELQRKYQSNRRNTQWGVITNRLYGVLQIELRQCSPWYSRDSKYTKALGYSFYDLYAHIASQFKAGMSWSNWGEWHIDHIRPLKLFRYESIEDPLFREAWALSNLQPLWKHENLKKGSKYTP